MEKNNITNNLNSNNSSDKTEELLENNTILENKEKDLMQEVQEIQEIQEVQEVQEMEKIEDEILKDIAAEGIDVINNKSSNKKKNENSIIIKSILASSLVSIMLTGGVLSINRNSIKPTPTITIKNTTTDNVYKAVATKATPSVVGITTLTINTNNFFNIPFESEGVGSGVIVDSRGYILTNSHVVSDGEAAKVSVMFADATSVDGKVVWNDSKLDIAIIKVEKDNLDVAELGDSDKVEVGDIAIAIGNPLGLEFNKTVTQGIISGLDRIITTENGEMDDLIQTDASINPGNSGGPLLNDKGQVIGINTAKASDAEGLGFSIPINTIKPIIEQVIKDGSFDKVTLGIKGVDASQFGLKVENGVYVIAVEENTPARKAGLSSGDIILELDGKTIENMTTLTKALYKYNKDDVAKLKINRDGQEKEINVQF